MGIHYDYKNTRGEKNLRKKQKRDQRRKSKTHKPKTSELAFPIDRPITLDDLTRPKKPSDD